GKGAHLGVDALVARHEQDAGLRADVDGQRRRHAREDDRVVQWNEQVFLHDGSQLLASSGAIVTTEDELTPSGRRLVEEAVGRVLRTDGRQIALSAPLRLPFS